MYSYQLYGLEVRSQIEFPGWNHGGHGLWDAEIVLHPVPETIEATQVGLRFQLASDRALYSVDRVGRYLVEKGERIIVDPVASADPDAVRLFCSETALPTLLAQREELALRGSAVRSDDSALVILGGQGAGKSAVAAALARQGQEILSDGLCVLQPDRIGAWQLQPGPAEIRLWADDLRRLGYAPADLPRTRPESEKRYLRIPGAGPAASVPVRRIYFLQTDVIPEIEIRPLTAEEAFEILQGRREAASVLCRHQGSAAYLQLCLTFARCNRFSLITRPRRGYSLQSLVNRLTIDLQS